MLRRGLEEPQLEGTLINSYHKGHCPCILISKEPCSFTNNCLVKQNSIKTIKSRHCDIEPKMPSIQSDTVPCNKAGKHNDNPENNQSEMTTRMETVDKDFSHYQYSRIEGKNEKTNLDTEMEKKIY